ncbi:MAG: hypothetical protein J7J20_01650, partial [Desulfurococcales archaeon]|nr:hypothetical protein [Desulfurococcales archaeon]
YKPEVVVKSLKTLGYSFTPEDLVKLGKRIYVEKHSIKLKEGYDPLKVRIPERILETPTPHGKLSSDYIKEALKAFKEVLSEFRSEVGKN